MQITWASARKKYQLREKGESLSSSPSGPFLSTYSLINYCLTTDLATPYRGSRTLIFSVVILDRRILTLTCATRFH